MDFQQISLVAAFVEAHAALRELDEVELASWSISIYARRSMEPALNRNWCGGMEKSGFVISRTPGWSKSSRFWLASTSADSFLRTRLSEFRMYSMATGLDSQI